MKRVMQAGFTLIELLLVLVIVSVFIVSGTKYLEQRAETMRIDKAVLQLQYLLNAGLASYVANGKWPGDENTVYEYDDANVGGLQDGYIPNKALRDPFGGFYMTAYYTSSPPTDVPTDMFTARLDISGSSANRRALAKIIAGRMPMAVVDERATETRVTAFVNIPGQSLNNAGNVNFAGLYHHGACVPVPSCPSPTTAQVFIVPVSVSGVNDEVDDDNIYPISSFTAFATTSAGTPSACYTGDPVVDCGVTVNPPPSGLYWRACLQVITERGNVQETRTDAWGNNVTLAAFVRCSIPNEPEGSDFTVFTH